MTSDDRLTELRADIDYEQLIENASPALQLYIRTLEQENARLRQELMDLQTSAKRRQRAATARQSRSSAPPAVIETIQHPDDVMVVSVTGSGLCKRTPLNDYAAQRRGGVGIFDIQTGRDDPVAHLLTARTGATLLVTTSRGRAFRVPVDTLPLTEIRGRGSSLSQRLMMSERETLAALLALDEEQDERNVVLIATASGWVRTLHRNYVGPRLQPGTLLFDVQRGGPPAAMTLSQGDGDVLVGLRSGMGIRFAERLVRRDGVRGIQVRPDDQVVGIASVQEEGAALLVTADGKGTLRQMSGFRANKSPGAQGKVVIKTNALAGLAAVTPQDDALCISAFSKIIRFSAGEIPAKTGAVQGVAVMDCRGDQLTALSVVQPPIEGIR